MEKIKKYFRLLYLLFALIFIGSCFTGAYFSDSVGESGYSFSTSVSSHYDIKLNEIYPDPVGDEAAAMPGGEWVELYNNGSWSIDVNGWYLYDTFDSHDLQITASNVGGGSTIIPAKGRLIVYRNADPDFSLNNGAETVRLFDGQIWAGSLIDSMLYSDTHEGRSWSRLPEGTGSWSDWHNPTPGGKNV